jgi:hypothetical protein
VELVRADGTRVETVGRTDASGYYATSFGGEDRCLSREGRSSFASLMRAAKEVFRATDPYRSDGGADVRTTATVPTPVVTRSTRDDRHRDFPAPTVGYDTRELRNRRVRVDDGWKHRATCRIATRHDPHDADERPRRRRTPTDARRHRRRPRPPTPTTPTTPIGARRWIR